MDDDELEDRDDDALARRELVLVVRAHEVMIDAGAELTIRVTPVAPTDEDPTNDFAASDVAPGNLSATVSVRS